MRAKGYFCAFKLDFFQLICKVSLTFKSNLELALSIILKQREYVSQSMLRWSVDVKNTILVIVYDMLVNPNFKMKTSFTNIFRTTGSTSKQVNLYTRKDFKSSGTGSLHEKKI